MENDQNTKHDFQEHKLVYVPHPALENAVPPLEVEDEDYRRELCEYMYELMKRYHGLGLAANQININAAVFVMSWQNNPLYAINPIINVVDGDDKTVLMTEGCLSDPGLYLKIKRPASIQASWETIEGTRVQHTLHGMEARVFQHEMDHLYGILFTDRVGKTKLNMARKKQDRTLTNFLSRV